MRKIRPWLHILLIIFTGGLWLFPFVIILATNEMHNRGYTAGKRAGRLEIANDPEWLRVSVFKDSGAYTPEPGHKTVVIQASSGGGSGGGASYQPIPGERLIFTCHGAGGPK